jgi:nicotinamide-nucleotide amidase
MKAELIIIGDEILNGKISDTNGNWLAKKFNKLGIHLNQITIIHDEIHEITQALTNSIKKADLVITSGGLGPTKDDKTKQALSVFLNSECRDSPQALEIVSKNYESFHKKYDKNRKLGENYHSIPYEVTAIFNPEGLAPGLHIPYQKKNIFCAPGVPKEFSSMIEKEFIPIINKLHPNLSIPKTFTARTFGIPEEKIFLELCPSLWEQISKFGKIGSYPKIGGVDLCISSTEWNIKKEIKVKAILKNSLLYPYIWQYGTLSMEEYIIKLANLHNITIACAESCTGGLLSDHLTNIPGSSKTFLGSVVCYSNQSKINILGVKEDTINNFGSVSQQCAKEMAKCVKDLFHANIGLSITGLTGPSGGTQKKPVGTVIIGISSKGNTYAKSITFNCILKRTILKKLFYLNALYLLLNEVNRNM